MHARIMAVCVFVLCAMPHSVCADLRIDEQWWRYDESNNDFMAIKDPASDVIAPAYCSLQIQKQFLIMPVKGTLTSFYGFRADPFSGAAALHRGIDVARVPNLYVRAAGKGIVLHAGRMGGCGIGVMIDHGAGLETRYCHLASVAAHRGEHVTAGDVIGITGKTGRATGIHLHFEVYDHGEAVDPVERVFF